ncbi:MAG: secondary thiamine-phosphate synthase enzyme YjbQ [Acidobacteriota bacterium]
MKIINSSISLQTKGFCDVKDITEEISDLVKKYGVKNGHVLIFVAGSTGGLTTIEYEPNLIKDFKEIIEKIIPSSKSYHHDSTWGDGNGFSHLRASLIGSSLVVPISEGKLLLGTWQQIVFIDFDNRPRRREIKVQISGE